MATMKTIAYLRVSKFEQDTEKFENDILRFCNEKGLGTVEFISEKISGKVPWRKRKIYDIISSLGKGDNLIVPELSRLGRNMLEIMEMLKVASEKGINVYDVKARWQLDSSIQSKLFATIFALFAEIERDLISMRTKEALQSRKDKGVKLGRPKGKGKSKLDQFAEEIGAMLQLGASKTYIARKYNVRPYTLYNFLKKRSGDV